MNTAVISSIIGTVGAAFIAVLIFYLQGLRDDIRALETRLGERIGGVEKTLGDDIRARESRLGERIGGVEKTLGERIGGVEKTLGDDIRARESRLGERIGGVEKTLGERIGGVESRLGRVEESLVQIATVQEEHGRKLDGIAGHGERISALEGAVAAIS